jgi:hypothetical protein
MDTTRHLLQYFFKVAIFLFFLAIVFGLFMLFSPALNLKGALSNGTTTPSQDILPSPRAYSGLLSARKNSGTQPKEYVHGAAFNGYNLENSQYTYSAPVSYVTYTASGTVTTKTGSDTTNEKTTSVKKATTTSPIQVAAETTPKVFIRNLSIYEGGRVYTGLSFVGEARSSMFREGRFPIVMVDASGRFIGLSAALATSDWTVPGWTRFETKINYVLPNNVPCAMIFEEALLPSERTRLPIRVPISMRCN